MSFVAAAIGGAAVIGAGATIASGVMGSNAAEDAANQQANAAANANTLQKYEFDTQQANMKPWLDAGTQAVNTLATGMAPGGQFSTAPAFKFDPSQVQTDPGYAWRTQQGVNALTAAGAAGGNLGSGNLGTSLINYGQNAASQEYQAAYNRAYSSQLDAYNSQLNAQNTVFNRLAGVAGTGQTAATQLGNAGANMASNVGNNLMTSATNQGNFGIQGAQALGNAATGVSNQIMGGIGAYNQNQLYQNYLYNSQPAYNGALAGNSYGVMAPAVDSGAGATAAWGGFPSWG